MAYQALYRTYRPWKFSEAVGQEAVIRTLSNQVTSGRISHAYLFSGPRGTGKTTIARIFARAINCLSPEAGDACGQCAVCQALGQENNLDILEIDAASNNGVDSIRDIRDNVGYLPANGKYRVYIIDEVHMLSTNAFNALLKTLEEPPAHAIFIMATTEIRKLPETVLSRCQRFEFRRFSNRELVKQLEAITAQLGANVEPRGLAAIARAAEGGMRDAISMLDQCISLSDGMVTATQVYAMLGTSDRRYFFSLSQAVLSGDTARALRGLSVMMEGGSDVVALSQELLRHFRDLFMCYYLEDPEDVLSVDEETAAQLRRQADGCTPGTVLRILGILARLEGELRYASQPRILLELALARCCREEQGADVEGLISRIEKLEQAVSKGVPVAATAPEEEATQPLPEVKAQPEHDPAQFSYDEAPPWDEHPPWDEGQAPPEVESTPDARPVQVEKKETPAAHKPVEDAPAKPAYVPIDSKVAQRVRSGGEQPGTGKALWSKAAALMRTKKPMVAAIMEQGRAMMEDDGLRVIYTPNHELMGVRRLEQAENRQMIMEALEEAAGQPVALTFAVEELSAQQQAFVEDSLRKLPKGIVEVDYET